MKSSFMEHQKIESVSRDVVCEPTNLSRTDRLSVVLSNHEVGICWIHPPDLPWSLKYYSTENGISNLYVYWWIAKDLAWYDHCNDFSLFHNPILSRAQGWYWPAHIFGALSLLWQAYILFRSMQKWNLEDVWINVTFLLWLFGHFWWMDGDLHDAQYPNENQIYDQRTRQTGYIFIFASIWISMYYLLLKPLHLLGDSTSHDPVIANLNWRFQFYFKSWKEYENAHSLFWILKDTAWNWWIPPMVVVFFIPTFLLSIDFVWVTLWVKHGLIDHAHYCAGLLWLCSASAWVSE